MGSLNSGGSGSVERMALVEFLSLTGRLWGVHGFKNDDT